MEIKPQTASFKQYDTRNRRVGKGKLHIVLNRSMTLEVFQLNDGRFKIKRLSKYVSFLNDMMQATSYVNWCVTRTQRGQASELRVS